VSGRLYRCLGDGNTSLQKLATSIVFFFCLSDVSCNSVEQKIYVELNNTVPCVRLLNATHQIGCQSSISGDTGVIHVLESEADLEWPLSKGPNPPYMVLLESSLFTRSIMMKMKNESNRVAGVAVVVPNTSPPEFSPHTTCPNENTGVYSDNYGPNLAHCNTTVWNPRGNGLSYEEFDFPVFSLKEDNETEFIKQCYLDHNRAVNGSAPQYPLCAMQLFSHMHAVTNTPTCMRRNDINFSINPGTQTATVVSRDTLLLEPCFLGTLLLPVFQVLSTRFLDSRAFFWEVSTGAEGSVSGFVTLLAAAQALREVTHAAPPTRNILFAFFQGETFDYIGSSRMVYDMENGKFVIDLDNIHSVLEIGQVAVHSGTNLFLHSDPVSRRNNTVNDEVREELFSSFFVPLTWPNVSQPLPPSSLQRFLRAQPIPGIVLADHESAFNNRYYESFYDNAANLNLTYPSDLSPEEQLEFVTDTAKSLTDVATVVARALYKQAGGDESLVNTIKADPKIVTQMLYGFLVSSNNSWFQAVMAPELKNILNELPNESRQMYSYLWVQGIVPPNSTERDSFCVRASVRLTKAVSPAFELGEYASKDYSTWTESRWKFIKARIFLVASRDLEMLTLGVGVAVLFTSLLVTYFISTKADVLFSSTREPASAAY
uniref:Nicastrin n=1 Tax=Oncorhynchus tshawytscha TaxID=74940 RepID=A0A8C8FEZ3_ONCTS